jgi:tetratricopeptide (TPR) repeat protein
MTPHPPTLQPQPGAADQALALAETTTREVRELFAQGRFQEALQAGESALQAWQQAQRPDDECELLVTLSLALAEADRHEDAIRLAREAHALVQAHDLEARLPRVLALLGGLHGPLNEWAEGESLLLLALSLARDRHDSATVAVALNGLLMHLLHAHEAQTAAGQQPQADATAQRLLQHARLSLRVAGDEPVPFRRVVLRSNAAAALLACRQPEEGLPLLMTALRHAETDGFRVVALRARSRLGHALLSLGQLEAARQQAADLQALLDAEDHALARLELLRLQARLAEAVGDERVAEQLHARHAHLQQPRTARAPALHQAMAGFNPQT